MKDKMVLTPKISFSAPAIARSLRPLRFSARTTSSGKDRISIATKELRTYLRRKARLERQPTPRVHFP